MPRIAGAAPDEAAAGVPQVRASVAGKFMVLGTEKLYVRGVTYGTFRPRDDGHQFPAPEAIRVDFACMAANGVNAVRTYTVPPRWLLDVAADTGLFVMVGLPWEHHVAFLDDREQARSIERRVRAGVAACAAHPAVLCYAVGNEIPSAIVRWHGRHAVERYIERLYAAAKEEDPNALVTYVNYPPTEYLQLPFLDLVCFNVYLERPEALDGYLGRLHSLSGERPLVLAEIGLDSRSHGEAEQARFLERQVRTAFSSGCAGAFVFGWTDEWYVSYLSDAGDTGSGGAAIEDWDFGLTRRDRSPKPALAAVRGAFADVPVASDMRATRVSVVVCTRNGERTLRMCLEGVARLEYPDFEVIVVNDGSTDATPKIAQDSGFRLVTTEWHGLGSARNTGMKAARGEIVAYLDDDAWPDPHWLSYLVRTLENTDHAAVGGPNIGPPVDGLVADCVANAPGAPTHVLLSDLEAEHLPGCNMAFRKERLEEIGGFDPRFRAAGDDVDICWRLQERGLSLGFHPSAMVWHHRRQTLGAYWKQQRGYGAAEALLERKWPEKYNAPGHLTWRGHVYGKGLHARFGRQRVDYGVWGSKLFQSLYEPRDSFLSALPLMPEWYLLLALLATFSAAGVLWRPLLGAAPILALAAGASLAQAAANASRASRAGPRRSRTRRMRMGALTTLLHLLQPAARLRGRLSGGLTPWRRRGVSGLSLPLRRTFRLWSEQWLAPYERLQHVESALRACGAVFRRGGDHDRWDLEVRGGIVGAARALMAVEEHGGGRQLVRLRIWPRWSPIASALVVLLGGLALAAAVGHAWTASVIAVGGITLVTLRWLRESAGATAAISGAFDHLCDASSTAPVLGPQPGRA
jgi:O-antigen biosynthesis protein